MAGSSSGKRGFGNGPWGGAGKLPWGHSVPKVVINKGLKVRAYKASLTDDGPKRPLGYKAEKNS